MEKKHQNIHHFDQLLQAEYGNLSDAKRQAFEAEAKAFYWRELLRAQREKAHLSRAELAARIHASSDLVEGVEEGAQDIPLALFLRILEGHK